MKEILLVDGYNMIGAWEELKQLKDTDIAQARDLLIEYMAEYQASTGRHVIIVFDAYEVKGTEKKVKQYEVEVIFTKEKETADECIEKLIKKIKNVQTQVYVATSDYAEQRIVFGQGALRKSARELYIEMKSIEKEIRHTLEFEEKNKPTTKIQLNKDLIDKFEKMRRGEF
jgi:hypothetical protein